MKHLIGRVEVAGVAALALGVLMPMSAAHGSVPSPRMSAAHPTSTDLAGYVATASASESGVTDVFKVPPISCTSAPNSAMAPGVFIFGDAGATPSHSGAAIAAECSGGTGFYLAVVVLNGTNTVASFTPVPGDVIKATVSQSAAAARATIADLTQKQHLTKSSATGETNTEVLWGIEAPEAIPTFTSVGFSNGGADGMTVQAKGGIAYNLKESTVVDISTGTVNAAGTGWREVFHNNS